MKRNVLKRIATAMLISAFAVNAMGCGASASTEHSETGQISVKVVNQEVTLNNCKFTFPEGYDISEGKFAKPIGISYAEISKDGNVTGVFADGFYSEDITMENVADAVNKVYTTVHSVDKELELSEDMFIETDNMITLVIGLSDGTAIYTAKKGTPNFAYVTQSGSDADSVMQDCLGEAVKTLGGQADYDQLFGE